MMIHPFVVTNNGVKGAKRDETPSLAAGTCLFVGLVLNIFHADATLNLV
jgi:hypothetical protein